MSVNLNNAPVEPTVTIYNPEGVELITTNNPTLFQYVRVEIKRQQLKGYTVCTHTGKIIDIYPNGKLSVWVDKELPCCVFDTLTMELI